MSTITPGGKLPAILSTIKNISAAYKGLDLGEFDDTVYQEILARGTRAVEHRFLNNYENAAHPSAGSAIDTGALRFDKNTAFNQFSKAVYDLTAYTVNPLLPLNLIQIVNGLPVLSDENMTLFNSNPNNQ